MLTAYMFIAVIFLSKE